MVCIYNIVLLTGYEVIIMNRKTKLLRTTEFISEFEERMERSKPIVRPLNIHPNRMKIAKEANLERQEKESEYNTLVCAYYARKTKKYTIPKPEH